MENRFLIAFKKAGIETWRVITTKTSTAELYFIKGKLDMPRFKEILETKVEIFHDFEENGMKFRGSTVCYVEDGLGKDELEKKFADAYYAASFVKNPFYELPAATTSEFQPSKADFKDLPLPEVADKVANAVLSAKQDETAFINSFEVFVERKEIAIESSNGTDVKYGDDVIWGELISQCTAPQDVEQYREFKYTSLALDELHKLATEAITDVRLRAGATTAPKTGTYSVIIRGENIAEILNFYGTRSHSSIIYPKYSTWAVGQNVQGEVKAGEKLNITLKASAPFSQEGIPMVDRPLLKDGVLETIHGSARFADYLGIEPTGGYEKVALNAGTVSYEDMKQDGVLECINFSDFQMDFFTGHFGGEVRLSVLHGKDGEVALTGGSINANILEAQGDLVFSKEQYKDSKYEGPYAVLIKNVQVAGL